MGESTKEKIAHATNRIKDNLNEIGKRFSAKWMSKHNSKRRKDEQTTKKSPICLRV